MNPWGIAGLIFAFFIGYWIISVSKKQNASITPEEESPVSDLTPPLIETEWFPSNTVPGKPGLYKTRRRINDNLFTYMLTWNGHYWFFEHGAMSYFQELEWCGLLEEHRPIIPQAQSGPSDAWQRGELPDDRDNEPIKLPSMRTMFYASLVVVFFIFLYAATRTA